MDAGMEAGPSTAAAAPKRQGAVRTSQAPQNMSLYDAHPRFSQLTLQPATQQTVVKTVTTTTIHYAPIRVPRPPSPHLSGDYGLNKKRFPMELASAASGLNKGQKEIPIKLGEKSIKAMYTVDPVEIEEGQHHDHAGSEIRRYRAPDRKGKRRMQSDDDLQVDELETRQLRGIHTAARSATHSPTSQLSLSLLSEPDFQPPPKRTRLCSDQQEQQSPLELVHLKSRPAPDSISESSFKLSSHLPLSHSEALAGLPSPNISPKLLACDRGIPFSTLQEDQQIRLDTPEQIEHKFIKQITENEEEADSDGNGMKAAEQRLSLGNGYELTTLLSLSSLISHFSTLTSELQTHVLYNLLRHSSVSVLQSVDQLIQPALKRDFISDLPAELSIQVLSYLDGQSVMRCINVSKNWKRLIDAQPEIWSGLLKAEDLWIGDTSRTEEKECELLAALGVRKNGRELGPRELLAIESERTYMFMKRWRDGKWDEGFNLALESRPTQEKLEAAKSTSLKPEGVGPSSHVSPSRLSRTLRLRHSRTRPQIKHSGPGRSSRPTSSTTGADPFLPLASSRDYIHPLKLLYKKRATVRNHWHSPTAPHRTTFPGQHSSVVTCLQFDNDKIVTASDDPCIDVYETLTGRLLNRLEGHEGGVWALQYVGNVLVSGSTDRTLRVWDIDTGNCTHVFYGHTSTVRCLQILEPVNGELRS